MSAPRSSRPPDRSAASRTLGWLAKLVLLAVLLTAPWFFGGVTEGVIVWLVGGVAAALVLAVAGSLFARESIGRLPWVAVPLGLAIVLGAFQVLPLPTGVDEWLSPSVVDLRAELTVDDEGVGRVSDPSTTAPSDPTAQRAVLQQASQPLSIYPSATRADLVLLALGVTVFALGFLLFAEAGASKWLLILVAVNGAVLACVGLVQEIVAEPGTILGIKLPAGGPFATFVNQNHAGGYLNLCLACAAGTLVLAWRQTGVGQTYVVDQGRAGAGKVTSTVSASLTDALLRLNNNIILCFVMTGLIVAGILCSLSRGAFLGMCAATLVAALVNRSPRGEHRSLLGAVAIIAGIAMVAWMGFGEIVTDRLGSLMDRQEMSEHSLLAHWAVAASAFPDFWLTGSGLGTYGYVYGMYEEGTIGPWFVRAENQYLEALVDGGIVGLAVLGAALVLVWIAAVSLARRATRTADKAIATAGLIAIGSQTVCAAFDFGLYAPANLMLMAILAGMVTRRSVGLRPAHEKGNAVADDPSGRWRVLPAVAAVLLLLAMGFGFVEARSAASAEAARRTAIWEDPIEKVEITEITQAIERLSNVADDRPGDADVQLRLGQLWTDLYRRRAVEQLRTEAPPGIDAELLWNLTSPAVLHRQLHALSLDDATDELNALRDERIVTDNLTPSVAHLRLARAACPLLPRVHLRLAELCGLTADPDEDSIHIDRACRVAPGDPDVWFRAGVLNVQAGRTDRGFTDWQRCLVLSDRYVDVVLNDADRIMEPAGLVDWLLPPQPALLLRLAQKRYTRAQPMGTEPAGDADGPEAAADENGPAEPTIRDLLLDRAEKLAREGSEDVKDEPLDQAERAHLWGAILLELDKPGEALAKFREATDLRPFELEWQYQYAQLLLAAGDLKEARDRAGRCVRMAPTNSAKQRRYQRLLEQIIDAS